MRPWLREKTSMALDQGRSVEDSCPSKNLKWPTSWTCWRSSFAARGMRQCVGSTTRRRPHRILHARVARRKAPRQLTWMRPKFRTKCASSSTPTRRESHQSGAPGGPCGAHRGHGCTRPTSQMCSIALPHRTLPLPLPADRVCPLTRRSLRRYLHAMRIQLSGSSRSRNSSKPRWHQRSILHDASSTSPTQSLPRSLVWIAQASRPCPSGVSNRRRKTMVFSERPAVQRAR
mmetsp:Transcript_96513/g.282088  ORF Transcript_96513/g.282088 Transcript_96513/m.282088 type:complete len:231 (-) Transcript_96513:102-794(-)